MERTAEEISFPGQILERFTAETPLRQFTEAVQQRRRKIRFRIQAQNKRGMSRQKGKQERAIRFRIGNAGGAESPGCFPQEKGRRHASAPAGTDDSGEGKT